MTPLPPGTALVTGAGRRIGRAIAEALAAAGWRVGVHVNKSESDGRAVADSILAGGGHAGLIVADLTDPVRTAGIVAQAHAMLGPVSLLVNNASVFEPDGARDFELALYERHMAIHVRAPLLLAREMALRLPEGAHGLIVNLIDQRVLRPNPRFFTYTLSKSALWAATLTLAQALAPTIRVNAIGPGPAVRNARQSEADFAAQAAAVPLGHGTTPAEIARAVLYLAETPSITGQMLTLDGGQHLAWRTPDVVGIKE